ncbi:hypothetical protein [Mycolicibacterium sp. YH-1]|uniref:hypothetical protein n=1 Tax=Mycolicibacterium sp. YH-1 TaxID=2908837 RepID=UPI001F4BEBA0|nr:hypothetical protein [Mycolicibacterium sp. YH-1]UNB52904.1 hypothetical protein L0M16_00500 [Mycolicibacterium sp. YH-1]
MDLASGAKPVLGNPLLRDLTLINAAGDLLFGAVGLLIIVCLNEPRSTRRRRPPQPSST